MDECVAKFSKYQRGVVSGFTRTSSNVTSSRQANEQLYTDFTNPILFSPRSLMALMVTLAQRMQKNVFDPEIFKKTDAYIVHKTPVDDIIKFTTKEAYAFVRSAYLEQVNTVEYLAKKKRLTEIDAKLNGLRTKSQIKRDLIMEKSRLLE